MAEILDQEILLDKKDRRKRQRKQFYKNWKTYAIGLGIIVIGTGTGVGIYFGVNVNQTQPKVIKEEDIIKAINSMSYQVETDKGSESASVINQIDSEFIKLPLSNEIKNAFNNDLFKFNKITVGDHQLNADDLKEVRTVDTKINYDYGAIKNVETTLTITINDIITKQDIVKAIESASYTINAEKGSEPKSVTSQVTVDFIKEPLSDKIKNAFNDEEIVWDSIYNVDTGEKLTANDLEQPGTINAKFDFLYYDTFGIAENLKIIVHDNDTITKQDIVKAIESARYTINVDKGSEPNSIINQIDSKFIKLPLSDEIKNAFNNDLFIFNKITVGDHDLNDNDLTKAGKLDAKINYDYDSIKGSETILTININDAIIEKDIVDAINTMTCYAWAKVNEDIPTFYNNVFNSNYIPGQFRNDANVPSDIIKAFESSKFKFNKIMINNRDLNPDDLKKINTIAAVIVYDYGSFKEQKVNMRFEVKLA